jgi:hypothetical protein
MPVSRRLLAGRKRDVGSTRPRDVALALEYLQHALLEAEAAARWYAERSPSAAFAFANAIDIAEDAIWTPRSSLRSRA